MPFQLRYTNQRPKIQGMIGLRPDGKAIVYATSNHVVATWDVRTGSQLITLELDPTLWEVKVSRDGQTAIARERNDYVSIWDIPTQRMLGRFPCIRGQYGGCRFETPFLSQDRTKLAGIGELGKIFVWEVPTGELLHSFQVEPDVTCMAIDPSGRILVAGCENDHGGYIHVWDLTTGEQRHSLHVFDFEPRPYSPYLDGSTDDSQGVIALWLSPDAHVIFQLRTKEFQAWDVLRGERLRILPSSIQWIGDFTADSRFVYTNAGVLDWRTGAVTAMRPGLSWMTRTMAISQDGRFWLTANQNQQSVVKDLRTNEEIQLFLFKRHSDVISDVICSPDDRTFITSSRDRTAKIWSLTTGELLHTLQAGITGRVARVPEYGQELAVTSTGSSLILFTAGKRITVWDGRSGQEIRSFAEDEQAYFSVAVSSDGQYVACGRFAYVVQIWDWRRGRLLHTFKHCNESGGKYSRIIALAFHPHRHTLISLDIGGQLRCCNFLTGESIASTITQSFVTAIAASPDQHLFATAADEGIKIWNLITDTLIHTILLHPDPYNKSIVVQCLAFSPDNRFIVAGLRSFRSENNDNIRIWAVASGEEQQSLPEPRSVTGLAFNSNGQTLISTNADAAVHVWQARNP